MAKKDREPTGWITVNGRRVPLFEGESKADAVKKVIDKNNDDKEKQIKKNEEEAAKKNGKNKKSFSAEDSAKRINAISMSHNNRGGDTENDWKQVRDILDKAPVGTVMIQTGDRGAKFQHTKGKDGKWYGDWDSDSKGLSMSWVGNGHRPEVEFTTPDKALTKSQLDEARLDAVNGKLDQRLGIDKKGRRIRR